MSDLVTRRPSGKSSWPILLLAGAEKAGKSWACAVASGSPLVGRTLWVGIGEDDPDEYGAIPGADFEIVTHDGTYRSILTALDACTKAPSGNDRPVLLVVDSMTRLWDLLTDDVQATANARARRKAEKYGKPVSGDDAQITMDLWNTAKQRWAHVMDTLRAHNGPVLVTARLEQVTVMDGNGQPTADKTLKVKAEKSLPYDVGGIIEMPEPGKAALRGVRSARLKATGRMDLDGFTVHGLWEMLGLAEPDATSQRHHAPIATSDDDPFTADPPASTGLHAALAGIAVATSVDQLRQVWNAHAGNLDTKAKAELTVALNEAKARLEATDTDTEPNPTEPDTRKASTGQLQDISIKLEALGITGRNDALAVCSHLAGRALATRKDITVDEAKAITAALKDALHTDDQHAAGTALVTTATQAKEQAA